MIRLGFIIVTVLDRDIERPFLRTIARICRDIVVDSRAHVMISFGGIGNKKGIKKKANLVHPCPMCYNCMRGSAQYSLAWYSWVFNDSSGRKVPFSVSLE